MYVEFSTSNLCTACHHTAPDTSIHGLALASVTPLGRSRLPWAGAGPVLGTCRPGLSGFRHGPSTTAAVTVRRSTAAAAAFSLSRQLLVCGGPPPATAQQPPSSPATAQQPPSSRAAAQPPSRSRPAAAQSPSLQLPPSLPAARCRPAAQPPGRSVLQQPPVATLQDGPGRTTKRTRRKAGQVLQQDMLALMCSDR